MNKPLFLFAIAILSITFAAKAQYFEIGGIAYNVLSTTEHTVEVVPLSSCAFYRGNITIPAIVTHNGITYDVVALGEEAFYGASLTGIIIPSSVTQIKYGCFLFATGVSSITIPASVANVETLAFASTNLNAINVDEDNPFFRSIDGLLFSKDTSTIVECPIKKSGCISLPQNTKHIAPKAFTYCQTITGITFSDSLLSIGDAAFLYASHINNIAIPAMVSHIGHNLFGGCSALNNLTLAEGNSHYFMDGKAIYSAAGDTLVSCHKSTDTVILPSTLRVVDGFNSNRDVKYVLVPDGVTEICDNAFGNSSLVSIDLPSQMTLIDEYAFYYCQSLTNVSMPASLNTMGEGVFEECSNLASIDIPNSLHIIPQEAFYGCENLSQITWGDSVAIIDSFAFGGCAFTELHLPPTLRVIRSGGFNGYYDGTIRHVAFSAPIDTIEAETFYGQPIGTLVLKNNVPPVATTYDGMYGPLDNADVDTILIPCGRLNAYLSDSYWGQFTNKYREDCNGIEDAAAVRVSVYPNPVTDRLTISGVDGNSYLDVVNTLGQPVLSCVISGNSNEIDVSSLVRGSYFLRIQSSDRIVTTKIILQ